MPEFKLEPFKHPKGRPPPRVIFTKNEYSLAVKMPEWDRLKEGEPKDNDPYNPPGGNQFLSTYKRIGHMQEIDHFTTTSRLMLEQYKMKEDEKRKSYHQPLVNYLTFKQPCVPQTPTKCSDWCAPDYSTTMQDSYQVPYPYVMQPLSFIKQPYLKYRRLHTDDGIMDRNKFYDDCYLSSIKKMQEVKKDLYRSYDPISQKYTDGTLPKIKKLRCFDLPYSQVN